MVRSIIAEGPDGSGKSCFMDDFHIRTRIPILRSGGPPKNKAELYFRCVYQAGHYTLFDRYPAISEPVYGPIIRGKSLINHRESDFLLRGAEPLILYMRPPRNFLIKRLELILKEEKAHKPRSHTREVIDNYEKILLAYDQKMLYLQPRFTVLTFNPFNSSEAKVIRNNVLDQLTNRGGVSSVE